MRRILPIGMVVFVAGAFALAVVTQGDGWIYIASVVSAAGVLIALVLLLALPGGRDLRKEALPDDFLTFERAAEHASRGGLFRRPEDRADQLPALDPARGDASREAARAFVRTLVPTPRLSEELSKGEAQKSYLDALRKEGRGLIRLANVTGVDLTPYRAFITDARKAALQGDANATLRSLGLANELLRASIERFLVKRRLGAEGPAEPLEL